MRVLFFGDYDYYLKVWFPELFPELHGLNKTQIPYFPPDYIHNSWVLQVRSEVGYLMKFYFGIAKCIGYPISLLFQILTIVFLIRGSSGYSRSARNWFLLVLSADVASTLYRVYDLITQDFQYSNPYVTDPSMFGQNILNFMWSLRRMEDEFAQDILCRVFFIILYFPIHLSPIALTVSAMIRAYCVKFPLRAKAVLTTRVDRYLMAVTVLLSLAISVILSSIVVAGWAVQVQINTFGFTSFAGECNVPKFEILETDRYLFSIGFAFMMAVIFTICIFNLISAIVIIIVLFEAKQNRKKMSASEGPDSNAEMRATAMLLGMSVTLFLFFFVSRVFVVLTTKINLRVFPIPWAVLERLGSYLFNIPYYTNWLFIAGFTRKFYEFCLPCLFRATDSKAVSPVTMKTMEDSRIA